MTPRENLMEEHLSVRPHGGERRQCTARSKTTGRRCEKAPIKGGTVCTAHGGLAPAVRAAAARRVAEATLQADAVTLGLPRDVSPTEALLGEIQVSAGHVLWYRERLQELDPGALTYGKTEYVEGASHLGEHYKAVEAAKPHVLLDLYDRERRLLADLSTRALSAGIEERRVQMAEGQGKLVAQVIRRVLERMGLSQEQQTLVGTVVPEELRALVSGGGPR